MGAGAASPPPRQPLAAPPVPGSPGSTCLAGPALAGDEDALVPVAVTERAVGVIGDGVAGDEEGLEGAGRVWGFQSPLCDCEATTSGLPPTPWWGPRAPQGCGLPCSHVGLDSEEVAVVILLHLLGGVDGQRAVRVHRDHHVPDVRLRVSGTELEPSPAPHPAPPGPVLT